MYIFTLNVNKYIIVWIFNLSYNYPFEKLYIVEICNWEEGSSTRSRNISILNVNKYIIIRISNLLYLCIVIVKIDEYYLSEREQIYNKYIIFNLLYNYEKLYMARIKKKKVQQDRGTFSL